MTLRGTVYFDFESTDSFRLFLLLVKAEQEGADIDLTWRPRPPGDEVGTGELTPWERALAAHALVREPIRQDLFRRGLFIAIHRQGDSPAEDLTYRAAAQVAGLDADILLEAITRSGRDEVEVARRHAIEAGVTAVPTIVNAGPALHVVTTAALDHGPASPRVDVIAAMLADDGLWRLDKP